MNLRDKFLWNGGLLLSALVISWSTWQLYITNVLSNDLLSNYNNEQVGTDKELEEKVLELESLYLQRDVLKFTMADNPVDLNKVISLEGSGNSKRRKSLWVSGIINRGNDEPMALMSFKDKTYNVVKGDSIAGGVIEDISSTEVVFKKNNKLFTYNLGINHNIE